VEVKEFWINFFPLLGSLAGTLSKACHPVAAASLEAVPTV